VQSSQVERGQKCSFFCINNNAPNLRAVMNYLKTYCNLIRKAEQRGYTKKKAKEHGLYVEGHHTFPKSIYGKNTRIVYLTAREHYIAHALLERICIQRYGKEHWKTKKMMYAFWSLNRKNSRNNYLNSYLYEQSKLNFSELMKKESIFLTENNPSKTPERREKMKNQMTKFLLSLSEEEYKETYSDRIEKTKIMFSGEGNPFYNKTHTQEVKDFLGELSRGTKWWNNGKENRHCKECPCKGWVLGMYYEVNPLKGKKRNSGIVDKVRESNCKYIYTFISPEGEIVESPYAKEICEKYGLHYVSIIRVILKQRNHHKGWKATRRPRNKDDK
jgi:hypothetical protein